MAAETYRITEEISVEDNTGTGLTSAEKKVSKYDESVQKTQTHLSKLTGSKWSMNLGIVDKATSVISNVQSKISSAIGKAWNFTVGLIDKVTSPLQSVIDLIKNPILQGAAALGITISLTDSVSTYADFESTMSKVEALSGATSEELEALTAKAQEMGATTKYTATESAEAFTYMAQAGWSAEEMMSGISGIMSLAASDGIELAEATDIVANALTAFGMTADDTQRLVDVLAVAASATNTDVSGLGEAFTYVAPVAGAMAYSVEDVSLALGLMSNNAVKGSMAGTSLKTSLANLADPTDEMIEAMEKYGITITDSSGNMKSLKSLLDNLRSGLGGLSEAEQTAAASTLFGKEAMAGMLAIVNTSEEDYNSLVESINNADGAAQSMSETMLDNLSGSITLLQSAFDGVKLSLGQRLTPYLRQFIDWLTGKMPDLEQAVSDVMDTVDEKIEWLKGTIDDFTSSDEWADADIWGKLSIAWEKIVAEPFSQWWDGSGKQWLTGKLESFGETLGSGITTGLLALLGIDAAGAVEDGVSIGASFVEGLKNGIDTSKISEALGFTNTEEWENADLFGKISIAWDKVIAEPFSEWWSSTGEPWLSEKITAFGETLGSGISGGLLALLGFDADPSNAIAEGKSLGENFIEGFKSGFDFDQVSEAITEWASDHKGTVALAGLTVGSKLIGGITKAVGAGQSIIGNVKSLFGGGSSSGGTTSGYSTQTMTVSAGTVIVNGSGSGTTLPTGSESAATTTLKNGTVLTGTGGAIKTGLATVGNALGSGATSLTGAAAVGGASIAGGIAGAAGLISAGLDVYEGIQKSQEGDSKGAKDEYVTAGTKTAMVGTGAAAGAAIGSAFFGIGAIPGALIGAGVGGVAALVGGNKAGKAISDSTDEGGWLNETGTAIATFFTETVPEKCGEFFDSVGEFFSSTVPEWVSGVSETVSTFFTQTVPEKFGEFWDSVGEFFTQTVPYAVGYAAGVVTVFFTETVPAKFGEFWDSMSTFFGETVPQWASDTWENKVVPFFTESIPEFFGSLWENIGTFFTETLPTWASDVWDNKIVPFFTEDVPEFFSGLWEEISTFFGETLPTWASDTWNNQIVPFFTEDIPGFFGDLWDSISGFVTETIPEWGAAIAEKVTGWWSSISGWFSEIWEGISGAFTLGYSEGSGGTGEHAEGGIFNATHVAQIAEDGPEAVVPLGASSRSRGMAVWQEAGDILGAYDNDGSAEGDSGGYTTNATATATTAPESQQEATVSAPISITMSPSFVIQGGEGTSSEDILNTIKEHIRELVDEISDEMAEKLAKIYANMPVKGGA